MIPDSDSTLKGHLRMVAGGVHFGLPLARVARVALTTGVRRLAPRAGAEAWWRGVALDGRRGTPVVGLSGLLGLKSAEPQALVYCRIGGGQVAFECEAVRGIVPASTRSDPLPASWFLSGQDCFAHVLRTPEVPVLELMPERLFPPRRRQALTQLMGEAESSVGKLQELGELEAALTLNPTAARTRELAQRYATEGWAEDARRVATKADALAALETTAAPALAAHAMTGAFTPRVLIELLQVLYLTRKSGELRLAPADGAAERIVFSSGFIIGADALQAEKNLARALGAKSGRYEFVPGDAAPPDARILSDTVGAIARLAEALR